LLTGKTVTTAPERLARDGRTVSAIVADGAARVVIRIRGDHVGQNLTLTLQDDFGGFSTPQQDGQLATIQGATSGSSLSVKTQSTTQGPMAFAIYLAPNDFNRNNSGQTSHDYQLMSRFVTLKVTSDDNTVNLSQPINILRPPIVLVHGMWDSPAGWRDFRAFAQQSAAWLPITARADYSDSLAGRIVSAGNLPQGGPPLFYNQKTLDRAKANGLSYDYNAPGVQQFIQREIRGYRGTASAAAARADVVGHSMGSLVARWGERLPGFSDGRSFGKGNIHMLITVGTPHLGSPLPSVILGDECASQAFTWNGMAILGGGVVLQNPAVPVTNGATYDLAADSSGNALAPNLKALEKCPDSAPMATLAGQADSNNYSALTAKKQWLLSAVNYVACNNTSTLLSLLTPSSWQGIFNNQASDAIVPVASQFGGGPGSFGAQPSTVHSTGLLKLFNGPAELQQGSNILFQITDLINTPVAPAKFFQCSSGGFQSVPAPGPPQ
jgi:pimeloyl-ACP methyl ester carboxylesterase